MEIAAILILGWLLHGAAGHVKGTYRASRDQRVAEVAKSYPKGALPKSRRKAAARQHAAGWWAREVRHGFPVTRTGWHAAWLAHQTAADHHKARREEARTTALETRASVLGGMPGHKERQAAAQAELDAIEAEMAAQQAKGSPSTGRRAVQSAADEVARKRAEREQRVHVRTVLGDPPLPADSVARTRRVDGRPETDADRRFFDHRESGYDGPLDKDGNIPPAGDPDAATLARMRERAEQEPGADASRNPQPLQRDLNGQRNVCAACGHPGTQSDDLVIRDGFRIHQSHIHDPASGYYEGPAPERSDELPGGPMQERNPDGTRKSDDDRHAEIDDAVLGADHGFEGEFDTHPSPTPARRVDGMPYDPSKVAERDADSATWAGDDGVPRCPSASAAEEAFPGWAGSSADYWSRLGPEARGLSDAEYSAAYRKAKEDGTLPPPRIPAGAQQPSGTTTASTGGTQVTADTNYTTVRARSAALSAAADQDLATIRERKAQAIQAAEDMQAAEVDGATLGTAMDLVDHYARMEEAAAGAGEQAAALGAGLEQRHGGLAEAHQNAPVAAAKREFYQD